MDTSSTNVPSVTQPDVRQISASRLPIMPFDVSVVSAKLAASTPPPIHRPRGSVSAHAARAV